MRNTHYPATPAVLDAFNWPAIIGPWEVRRTPRNTRPVIAAALAQARSRSRALSPP